MLQVASLAFVFCMPLGRPFLYQRSVHQMPFPQAIAHRLGNASPVPEAHFRRNRNIFLLVSQRLSALLVNSVARTSRCDVILEC